MYSLTLGPTGIHNRMCVERLGTSSVADYEAKKIRWADMQPSLCSTT